LRASSSLVVALVALVALACDRPRPLVFCHNANCAGQPSSEKDDRIEGLREALALEWRGAPLLDGIELDFVWDGTRCLFAHVADAPGHAEAAAAIDELLAWRTTHPGPFVVLFELKPTATPAALASCALDELERLEPSGLSVRLDSSDPDVLRAVLADPRAASRDLHLVTDFSAPRPIVAGAEPLSAFEGIPIDSMVVHPSWITAHSVQIPRELGVELTFWSVLLGSESLDAIDRFEPEAVTTGDAPFLRAWLEW
jgi:hypothetical protein